MAFSKVNKSRNQRRKWDEDHFLLFHKKWPGKNENVCHFHLKMGREPFFLHFQMARKAECGTPFSKFLSTLSPEQVTTPTHSLLSVPFKRPFSSQRPQGALVPTPETTDLDQGCQTCVCLRAELQFEKSCQPPHKMFNLFLYE